MIKRIPATNEPCIHAVGQVKRLDGRQVRIESVDRESLGAVTQRQLVNEGWKSRSAWRAWWVQKYDERWLVRHWMERRDVGEVELCRRFGEHWASQDHWVIRYIILDAERFLANQQGVKPPSKDGQYVSMVSKAIDPLPVMDPDPAFIRQVRERDAKIRAERAASFRQDYAVAKAQRNAERGRERNVRGT